jgi:hypothetical protein
VVPESEQAALQSFVKGYKPEKLADCLKCLKQAAYAKLVEPKDVEGALVFLEQNFKQSESKHPTHLLFSACLHVDKCTLAKHSSLAAAITVHPPCGHAKYKFHTC